VDLKRLISAVYPFEQSVEAFGRAAAARPGDVKLQIRLGDRS
jgi:D-xylulose reductase